MNRTLLERIYFILLILIFVLITGTPYLIKGGFSIFAEETLETILIFILFILAFIIFRLHEHNQAELENKLDDAFRYIGQTNVQVQEMTSVFSEIKKYPENKKDLKDISDFLGQKILGIIKVDWLILRIVDLNSFHTLHEHCATRGQAELLKHEIHNKDLVNQDLPEMIVISSGHENLSIRAYCVMPKVKLDSNQSMMVKTIVNKLEMMFLVFNSIYYKSSKQNISQE